MPPCVPVLCAAAVPEDEGRAVDVPTPWERIASEKPFIRASLEPPVLYTEVCALFAEVWELPEEALPFPAEVLFPVEMMPPEELFLVAPVPLSSSVLFPVEMIFVPEVSAQTGRAAKDARIRAAQSAAVPVFT